MVKNIRQIACTAIGVLLGEMIFSANFIVTVVLLSVTLLVLFNTTWLQKIEERRSKKDDK